MRLLASVLLAAVVGAVWAYRTAPDPRVAPLVARYEGASEAERPAVLEALAELGPTAAPAVPTLLRALEGPATRPAALAALYRVAPERPELARALEPMLAYDDPFQQLDVMHALGFTLERGNAESHAVLRRVFDDPRAPLRLAAACYLAEVEDSEDVFDALTAGLDWHNDPGPHPVSALRNASSRAVPALVRTARAGASPEVRGAAFWVLRRRVEDGERPSPDLQGLVVSGRADPDADVRTAAADLERTLAKR